MKENRTWKEKMVETVKKFHVIKEMSVCIHLTFMSLVSFTLGFLIFGDLSNWQREIKKIMGLVITIITRPLPQILWNLYITDLVDEENFQI